MLCAGALVLMAAGLLFAAPILKLFGASDAALPYAYPYLMIYLLGTLPSMIATGMNPFINAQGYSVAGMLSVAIGAVTNFLLDPLFIFVFHLESPVPHLPPFSPQTLSALYVIRFLHRRAEYKVRLLRPAEWKSSLVEAKHYKPRHRRIYHAAHEQSGIHFLQQCPRCNLAVTLYISVMTIISSVRQMVETPIYAINGGTSPILSYNYGARRPGRVRKAILTLALLILLYTAVIVEHHHPCPADADRYFQFGCRTGC